MRYSTKNNQWNKYLMLKFMSWLDGGHWHIHLSCPGLTIVTFFFQMRPNTLSKSYRKFKRGCPFCLWLTSGWKWCNWVEVATSKRKNLPFLGKTGSQGTSKLVMAFISDCQKIDTLWWQKSSVRELIWIDCWFVSKRIWWYLIRSKHVTWRSHQLLLERSYDNLFVQV